MSGITHLCIHYSFILLWSCSRGAADIVNYNNYKGCSCSSAFLPFIHSIPHVNWNINIFDEFNNRCPLQLSWLGIEYTLCVSFVFFVFFWTFVRHISDGSLVIGSVPFDFWASIKGGIWLSITSHTCVAYYIIIYNISHTVLSESTGVFKGNKLVFTVYWKLLDLRSIGEYERKVQNIYILKMTENSTFYIKWPNFWANFLPIDLTISHCFLLSLT